MIEILLVIGAIVFGLGFIFLLIMGIYQIFCAIREFVEQIRDGRWKNW